MLSILHVLNNNSPTNMGYNEFHLGNDDDSIISTAYFLRDYKSGALSSFSSLVNAIRSADVIHVHTHQLLLFVFIVSLFFDFKKAARILYTVHTSYENLNMRNRMLFFVNFIIARRVIFCSNSSQISFPKFLSHFNKAMVIRNGVHIDHDSFNLSKRSGFAVVGRLTEIKNPKPIITLFSNAYNNKILTVVGDGNLKPELESDYANCDNIIFTGLIDRQSVLQILDKCSFFISNSTVEGLPISVLESIAYGCVPILSNIPPHKEILDAGIFCFIFDNENFSLNDAIRSANEMSDEAFNKHQVDNFYILKSKFSLSTMRLNYSLVYKSLI